MTILKLLCLLTTFTKAEESSILDGAIIYNPGDFNTEFLPDLNLFFGDAFKTMLHSLGGANNYLGDDSKEVKIKMAEKHKVITVFLLQRNGDVENNNRRSDNSEVWVGDDDGNYSSSFTQIISGIYGAGFNHATTPVSGSFINIRRYGLSYPDQSPWNAMSMKAYETPNLLSLNSVTITSDTSIG